jgi:hypothetical protein
MDQALCRFGQIQLQMTTQAGVVIEYGQYHGTVPLTQCIENANFCLVKVQVPEAMDMEYFETAYLTVLTFFLPALKKKGYVPPIYPSFDLHHQCQNHRPPLLSKARPFAGPALLFNGAD